MSEDTKNNNIMAAGTSGEGSSGVFIPLSPPNCVVDDSPLQGNALNKNKESLKVKLMLRRPREDLVNRGVIPPMNTPTAFYEQRQKLDMAKKHDILKHKMQRRPLREELVRQHILEDHPGNMDPSLVEKQKQLKRARIADTISDHLCQRPGPLELVRANILHTSEDIEKAVKEGQLMFKSTCEGEPRKHPCLYIPFDDESSSEGGMSPEQLEATNVRSSGETIVVNASSSVIHTVPATLVATSFAPTTILSSCISTEVPPSPSFTSNTSSLSPLSSLASPQQAFLPSPQTPLGLLVAQTPLPHALTTPPLQYSAPGKDPIKSRKKLKGKAQAKARTIKFHEYKGPPSASRRDRSSTPIETSYDILLQQQQLFLQCQLELQQKYNKQFILPASLKSSNSDAHSAGVTLSPVLTLTSTPPSTPSSRSATPVIFGSSGNPPIAPAPPNHSSASSASHQPPLSPELASRLPAKLEDLKVSDLKMELKRRNLPISGSKTQLIERLKFFGTTPLFSLTNKASVITNTSSCNASSVIKNSDLLSKVKSDLCNFDNNSEKVGNKNTKFENRSQKSQVTFNKSSDRLPVLESSENSAKKSSIDLSSHLPAELLRTSVDEDVLSSTYSHITSSPACTSPMDVDFDTPLNEADLKGFSTIPLSVTEYSNQREGGSINTPPPPPPPPPPTLDVSPFSSSNDLELSLNRVWNTISDTCNDGASSHDEGKRGRTNDFDFAFGSETLATAAATSVVPENQEGVDHLKKKIEDLQRELITTQRRLEDQQKRSNTIVRHPKEISRRNSDGAAVNHKISHDSLSKAVTMMQQQYPSQCHTLHLKSNNSNGQGQLDQNSVITSNANVLCPSEIVVPFQENAKLLDSSSVLAKNSQGQVIHRPESILIPQPPMANRTKHLLQIRKSDLGSDGNCSPSTMGSAALYASRSFRPSSFVIPGGVIISTHHRASSLPNFSNSVHLNGKPSSSDVTGPSTSFSFSNDSAVKRILQSSNTANSDVNREVFIHSKLHLKPPPNYNEAIKQCKAAEPADGKCSNRESQNTFFKSHQVDDVLEILIKNGELPPSAAQESVTSAMSETTEPVAYMSSSISNSTKNSFTIPPPPPPPPPSFPSVNQQVSSTSVALSAVSPSTSFCSPSLFADLVMGSKNSKNMEMRLDLDMFDGMEFGVLDQNPASSSSNNNSLADLKKQSASEVVKMEVGEDVDVASWLDTIAPLPPPPLPPTPSNSTLACTLPLWEDSCNTSVISELPTFLLKTPESRTSSGVSSMRSSLSSASSTSSSTCGLNYNQCDPLLGSQADQMDIFNVEDLDLRPVVASDLSWDRIDFPT